MISSYSPDKKHQQWMKSRDEEARKKRTMITESEKVCKALSTFSLYLAVKLRA